MCHFALVLPADNIVVFAPDFMSVSECKMQSVAFPTSSSSKDIGQYLSGIILGWLKMPGSNFINTVLPFPGWMPDVKAKEFGN